MSPENPSWNQKNRMGPLLVQYHIAIKKHLLEKRIRYLGSTKGRILFDSILCYEPPRTRTTVSTLLWCTRSGSLNHKFDVLVAWLVAFELLK
jgi:hypothetical protein